MMNQFNRNIFLQLNKYQKRIVWPVLISCALASMTAIICLAYMYYPDSFVIFGDYKMRHLKVEVPKILTGIAVLLIFISVYAYHTANKLVGPHNRILRELDDVLSGKRKDPLGTRKGDEMFEELLKRINALIR